MTIANKIKTARAKAGLSQSELAERAGLALNSIQNWEQGQCIPRLEFLPILADALKIDVRKLLK